MENINPNFETKKEHEDDLIDEALKETFPASDPISPALPRSRSEAEKNVNKNVEPKRDLFRKVMQHKLLIFSSVVFVSWVSLLIRRKLHE